MITNEQPPKAPEDSGAAGSIQGQNCACRGRIDTSNGGMHSYEKCEKTLPYTVEAVLRGRP